MKKTIKKNGLALSRAGMTPTTPNKIRFQANSHVMAILKEAKRQGVDQDQLINDLLRTWFNLSHQSAQVKQRMTEFVRRVRIENPQSELLKIGGQP